jgi:hypothetical protein
MIVASITRVPATRRSIIGLTAPHNLREIMRWAKSSARWFLLIFMPDPAPGIHDFFTGRDAKARALPAR